MNRGDMEMVVAFILLAIFIILTANGILVWDGTVEPHM